MTFPLHEKIISTLREDPGKGEKILAIFLKNPANSTVSKLQLMALLLNEFGEKRAALVYSSLPLNPAAIVKDLTQLSLNFDMVDKLIELLSKKKYKLIREEDKGFLYYNLALNYMSLQDAEGELHYLLKAAKFSNLLPIEKHHLYYSLGVHSGRASDTATAVAYFQVALDIEKTQKVDRENPENTITKNAYVVARILDSFNAQELVGNEYYWLKLLLLLEPKDPRILEAISLYLDQSLSCIQSPEQVATYIREFSDFLNLYPALKSKRSQIAKFISNLPEELCPLNDKVFYLFVLKRYKQVIELAHLVTQQNKNDSLTWLAMSYYNLDRKKEALQTYQIALLSPLSPEKRDLVLAQINLISLEIGNYEEENNQYSYKLSEALYNLHQYEDAQKTIWSFLRSPESHSKENCKNREDVLFLLFKIYKKTPCFENIATVNEALVDLSLSFSDSEKQIIHFSLAQLYYDLNQTEEVEKELQQALAFGENFDSSFYKLLGIFYYETDRTKEAVEPLKKALRCNKKDTDILYCLGAALYLSDPFQRDQNFKLTFNAFKKERAHQKKKACDYFYLLLKLDPSELPQVQEILSKEDYDTLLKCLMDPVSSVKVDSCPSPATQESESRLPVDFVRRVSSVPVALTPEQKEHQYFQRRKKEERESLCTGSESKDAPERGWNLPSGFLSENDPRVFQLSIAQHLREKSHFYAFVDIEALQKICPDENLLSRLQNLVRKGDIVGNQGQTGVRIFNHKRATQTGYDGDVKMLGFFGDMRAYGKFNTQGNKKLLYIDHIVLKSH